MTNKATFLPTEAESMAGQLAKQQSAVLDAEKAFAKFIARSGPDVLEAAGVRELLLESGLSPKVWNRLLVASQQRSGKGTRGKGASNGAMTGVTHSPGSTIRIVAAVC